MKSTINPLVTLTLGGPEPKLKNITISSYAERMLKKVTYQKKKETIELVVVKIGDMGIDADYPTTTQIYQWASENNLALCPAEVGPRLREQYDQPNDEWLVIGMEPIPDPDGYPNVFRVFRLDDGGRWLDDYWTEPGHRWHPEFRFVFRKVSTQTSDPQTSDPQTLPSEPLNLALDEITVNGIKYRRVEE